MVIMMTRSCFPFLTAVSEAANEKRTHLQRMCQVFATPATATAAAAAAPATAGFY